MGEPRVYFDACCFLDMAQTAMNLPILSGRAGHVYACKNFLKAARAKAPDAFVYTSTVTMVECGFVIDPSKPEADQKISDAQVQKLFRGMLQSGTSGVTPVATTPRSDRVLV